MKVEQSLQIIKTFESINNISVPINICNAREGDIPYSVADISYAFKLFKWKPKRNLNNICKDALNWVNKHPDGYL